MSLPTELTEADHPESIRKLYRVVRLDSGADLPGFPVSASERTGLALMQLPSGARQEFVLGEGGLRIVGR